MPKQRRLPTLEHEDLIMEIRDAIAVSRDATRRRAALVLQANQAGLSARTIAEAIGEPEGTLFSWIRQAKAAEQGAQVANTPVHPEN